MQYFKNAVQYIAQAVTQQHKETQARCQVFEYNICVCWSFSECTARK